MTEEEMKEILMKSRLNKMSVEDRLERIEAQTIKLWNTIDEQGKRITSLEEAATKPKTKLFPNHMTTKEALALLGQSGNQELSGSLKYFARKHALDNGLKIEETPEGKRIYKYFPKVSMKYAMDQVRGSQCP